MIYFVKGSDGEVKLTAAGKKALAVLGLDLGELLL
jgi:hypothetical protein